MFLKLILWLANVKLVSLRPADCFPSHCFCENIGRGIVRQPIDAYSNVIYVIVGVYIIFHLIYFSKDRLKYSKITNLPRKILYVLAFASIAVGFGSFLYHAKFNFLGEQLDDDSMYLVGSFLLLSSFSHFKKFAANRFVLSYVLLNIFLEILILIHPLVRGLALGLLIVSMLFWENKNYKLNKNKLDRSLVTGVLLFVFGYAIWILDYTKIFCFPYSIFQGHAVWHILTGLAIYFMYSYQESEFINKV
jgi:hypothetical protein